MSPRRAPVILAGLLGLAAAIRIGIVLHARLDPDESEHLHAAWLVGDGRVPFLDFWDHHAPLFFYLLAPLTRALADSPHVYVAARLLMSATSAIALVLVYRLARRLSAAAAIAAVLLLAFLSSFADQTTEVRPDVPALVAWLGTLLALVRWRERAAPGWLWAAGLLLGGAATLNLKTAYGAVGVAAVVALTRGEGGRRASRRGRRPRPPRGGGGHPPGARRRDPLAPGGRAGPLGARYRGGRRQPAVCRLP